MGTNQTDRDELEAIANVSLALKWAGLNATPEQVTTLIDIKTHMQHRLQEIRQAIDADTQPALIFPASRATWMQGDENAE